MMRHRYAKGAAMFWVICCISSLVPLSAFSVEKVESPVRDARVTRAQFTTGVSDREPVDRLVKVNNSVTSLYYFTELHNLQGRTVSHRWEHDGRVISEVSFLVEGPRWRVFSKKTLDPAMLGKWTVFVIDESGWPIHASIFEYTDSSED